MSLKHVPPPHPSPGKRMPGQSFLRDESYPSDSSNGSRDVCQSRGPRKLSNSKSPKKRQHSAVSADTDAVLSYADKKILRTHGPIPFRLGSEVREKDLATVHARVVMGDHDYGSVVPVAVGDSEGNVFSFVPVKKNATIPDPTYCCMCSSRGKCMLCDCAKEKRECTNCRSECCKNGDPKPKPAKPSEHRSTKEQKIAGKRARPEFLSSQGGKPGQSNETSVVSSFFGPVIERSFGPDYRRPTHCCTCAGKKTCKNCECVRSKRECVDCQCFVCLNKRPFNPLPELREFLGADSADFPAEDLLKSLNSCTSEKPDASQSTPQKGIFTAPAPQVIGGIVLDDVGEIPHNQTSLCVEQQCAPGEEIIVTEGTVDSPLLPYTTIMDQFSDLPKLTEKISWQKDENDGDDASTIVVTSGVDDAILVTSCAADHAVVPLRIAPSHEDVQRAEGELCNLTVGFHNLNPGGPVERIMATDVWCRFKQDAEELQLILNDIRKWGTVRGDPMRHHGGTHEIVPSEDVDSNSAICAESNVNKKNRGRPRKVRELNSETSELRKCAEFDSPSSDAFVQNVGDPSGVQDSRDNDCCLLQTNLSDSRIVVGDSSISGNEQTVFVGDEWTSLEQNETGNSSHICEVGKRHSTDDAVDIPPGRRSSVSASGSAMTVIVDSFSPVPSDHSQKDTVSLGNIQQSPQKSKTIRGPDKGKKSFDPQKVQGVSAPKWVPNFRRRRCGGRTAIFKEIRPKKKKLHVDREVLDEYLSHAGTEVVTPNEETDPSKTLDTKTNMKQSSEDGSSDSRKGLPPYLEKHVKNQERRFRNAVERTLLELENDVYQGSGCDHKTFDQSIIDGWLTAVCKGCGRTTKIVRVQA